ncbi:galactosyl transferase GMA12/MNN10 family protein [Phlyctema vagabunda]|uniref:Galactosyl transferase GMA12/MNN10 family protein n=1 Tax=Phlyctema vagabunda TaxID=108571 RepID=A0ABR4PGG2_9HELO
MHLALPSRKTSNPPPYAPSRFSRMPLIRRRRIQTIAIGALVFTAIVFIFSRILGGGDGIPSGTPPVVIVTVIDSVKFGKEYVENVKENRIEYARKHGYTTFFPEKSDYDLKGAPASWSKVPAVRHAMTKYPHSKYMWFLDQHSFIMNPDLTIDEHIMDKARLESLLIKDQPIVPPDSVIKTFSSLNGDQVDLVLTQDNEGLAQGSFLIRNGEWAKFFLDTWFDPLYRSYNFQKADTHALEHIVQWHPTILSRLGLVPQKIMNSYHKGRAGTGEQGTYKDGDFVVRFAGCEKDANRDCMAEADPFSKQWRTIFNARR